MNVENDSKLQIKFCDSWTINLILESMSLSGKKKNNTLAETLVELSNPAPIDIDPEEFGETFRTYGFEQSDEEEEQSDNLGREHYVQVGKSSLRQNLQFILDDPKYVGKRNSRKAIFRDFDSESDVEMNSQQINSNTEDESDDMDNNTSFDKKSSDIEGGDERLESDHEVIDSLGIGSSVREELRKIKEDERNLLQKMTQSAQEDINKGHQVKNQIGLWGVFLDTRIRLQKAMAISNTFPQPDVYPQFLTSEARSAIQETRTELRELIDSLIDLRKGLCHENENIVTSENTANSRKRHLEDDNYLEYLWKDMQEIDDLFLPYRTQTIEKWSNKVQITSGIPLNKKFKAINQSVNDQITHILYDREQSDAKTYDEHLSNYDTEIFDDTDFYQQLLRELIENRTIDTDDPVALGLRWATLRQTKQKKKNVDTKASKGRRLRYQVHEKLQNFMVPIPSGTWHDDMIDELYSSLLGKKYDGLEAGENEKKEFNDNHIEAGLDGLLVAFVLHIIQYGKIEAGKSLGIRIPCSLVTLFKKKSKTAQRYLKLKLKIAYIEHILECICRIFVNDNGEITYSIRIKRNKGIKELSLETIHARHTFQQIYGILSSAGQKGTTNLADSDSDRVSSRGHINYRLTKSK
ncbi:13062_t:CDS:10 [Gigaspora margarita]|uniref:Protein BFR2 n=1 Tax=Gigaspora margarita TaxID=4874 RepID=A0ABN7UKQ2_GIGMA|nr:13062_t:CDS:10 [Gigaspora margarita]